MSFLEEDSILLSFDVNNLDQYLDVNNLRMFYYGVQGRWLAVATLRHLLVMEGVEGGPASECGERQQHIQIANFIPEYGYPMCLQWILGGVLIVGFDTGYAVCFDDSASVIAEHKFSENALVSIQVDNSSDRSVWLLYENGKCIAAPIAALIGENADIEGTVTHVLISNQSVVNDFLFLPCVFHSLFDGTSQDLLKRHMLVAGIDKSLSLLDIGMPNPKAAAGMKSLTPKKEKSRSFFSSFFGTSSSVPTTPTASGRSSPSLQDSPHTASAGPTELSPLVYFDDPKRRILRVSVDPTGKLIATADNVGRVMLFDIRVFVAIRIWKGLREARLAWTEGRRRQTHTDDKCDEAHASNEDSSGNNGLVLCLAIYSPMTGLCNLWTMKHGPCLRSIPVGPQCFIYTVYSNQRGGSGPADTERSPAGYAPSIAAGDHQPGDLTTCILLMHDHSRLVLSSVSPFGKSKSDLDAHRLDLMLDLEHESFNDVESRGLDGVSEVMVFECDSVSREGNVVGSATAFDTKNSDEYIDGPFSSEEECREGLQIINNHLENGINKVQVILDTFGCCSGILRNDSKTHSEHLMDDLERKIAVIMVKISSHEVSSVCVAAIDAFERRAANLLSISRSSRDGGRTPAVSPMKSSSSAPGVTPPFHGRGPVSANDRIASLNVGSSNRWFNFSFSIQFHHDLASMLESCGRSSSHYGVMIEAEVRSRLLSAYEALLNINSGVSVHANSMSDASNPGLGSAGSLMRYGEWRSEAFRWAGRLHRLQETSSQSGSSGVTVTSTQRTKKIDTVAPAPPPAGMSIDIINMSPTSSTSRKMFGDRPVLRKGFSFAELKSDTGSGDQSTADGVAEPNMSDPLSVSGVVRSSYVLPNATLTHRVTATHGAVNCSPHCMQNESQETNDGSFLAVTPVLPFGVFRSMHSIDPAGERKTNVAVNFRASFLCAFAISDLTVHTDDGLPSVSVPDRTVVLDNCLRIERDVDTDVVTKSYDSFGTMHSNIARFSSNYAAMLASTALPLEDTEATVNTSWIPDSVIDNTWVPEASVLWDMLSFICSPPLFSDPFNLPMFSKAMLTLGLGSGTGLYHYLSCLATFTNRLPVTVLINVYYNKPSVSVLFFRWLKEVLLDFFQFYSSGDDDDVSADDHIDCNMTQRNDNGHTTRDELLRQISEYENTPLRVLFPMSYSSRKKDDLSSSDEEDGAELSQRLLLKKYPSFDEVVRVIFKPSWVVLQTCPRLEHAMTFSSMILDVFEPVSDQTERRSRGADSLTLSKHVWENFSRQLRVCLLLSLSSTTAHYSEISRAVTSKNAKTTNALTVAKLGNGDISIYRILAEDTLCFAELPEHAVSHEQRCLEVSRRNATAGLGSNMGATLQAWGPVADLRWKEIVAIVEAEDSACSSNAPTNTASRTNSISGDIPNKQSPLTADKNQTTDSRVPRDTLFGLSGGAASSTKRSISAVPESSFVSTSVKKIHRRRPLLILFSHHNLQEPLGAYRSMILAERWCRRPKKVDKLSLAADHLHSLPSLSRAVVAELILGDAVLPLIRTFLDIEENVYAGGCSKSDTVGKAPAGSQELLAAMSEAQSTREIIRATIDLFSYVSEGNEYLLKNSSERLEIESAKGSDHIWPPVLDTRLARLQKKFHQRGGVRMLIIDAHLALLCVLQLRAECGLRGIRPSRLFGAKMVSSLCRRGVLGSIETDAAMNDVFHDDDPVEHDAIGSMGSIRTEFIMQCFRQLGSTRSSTLYRLAALWAYSLHEVRIMHINALLELYLDELVDEMIPQIANFYAVVDCITEQIRRRLGFTLLRLENLSGAVDLIPLIDPDAAAWCKHDIPPPETAVLEAIIRGRSRIAEYNLNSTKHLVIQIQALLLSVPSVRRDESWLVKKQQCDALHSLCSFLFSPSAQAKLQRKGLAL